MALNYRNLLYGPNYVIHGVPATITPIGLEAFDVTVLDKTAGIEVTGSGSVEVQTIKPAAVVRMYELELHGVTPKRLLDAAISFNGSSWTIASHIMRPSPNGEKDGEVFLILDAVENPTA